MTNDTKGRPPVLYFKFTLEDMNSDVGTFGGYASVWDEVDSYGDIVVRGAFKKTLKDNKGKGFPMLWSHKVDEPIGIIRAEEDDHGLKVKGEFNLEVARALETRALMKQGAVTGLSIGYQAVVEEWDKNSSTRKLKEIKLWEISPVVFPACQPARAEGVKSDEEALGGLELKPYPNEHACRLREPGLFQEGSFRRTTRDHKGKEYSVIMGKLKNDDKMTEQAYRYAKDTWTADEAKTHCASHDGKFEAASGKCAECSAELDLGPDGKSTPDERPDQLHLYIEMERARLVKHQILWRS